MKLTLDIVRQRLDRHAVACPPGCGACCGPAPVDTISARRAGIAPGLTEANPSTGMCTHLDGEKRCGIYAERPVPCRLVGAVEWLPCPLGLKPAAGYLPRRQAEEVDAWYAGRVKNDPPLRAAVTRICAAAG